MSGGFVALGLVQGALAGLNALGLVLLWRTTRVVNLAQPAIGLVGGVLTGLLVASSGWSFWWAAPIGVACGALLGFVSERLVMVRLARHARAVPMVATIGLAGLFQAMQSGLPFIFGGRLPSYDVDIGIELFVFPVLLKGPHLLALALLPIALAAVSAFTRRTRIGVAAVAVGQDIERAQTLGVNAGHVRAVSWSIAGALSGLSGVLAIPVLGFSLGDGVAPTVLLLALAPAVLARLRSLRLAVLASLAVGVGYQYALVQAPTAGLADVYLAVVVIVALAVHRKTIERESASARVSSWAAATTPPALPRVVRRARRWRAVTAIAACLLVVAAAVPPLWLAPSGAVRYGTGAAFVLAAVAAASAWMFAGELALGHWGIAALGATTAAWAPGPLSIRIALAVGVGIAAGVILAAVGRQRAGLATAVAGVGLAVAAPYWLLRGAPPSLEVDPQLAAVSAGAIAALVAIVVTWLRGQRLGMRMVAARDDARRAASLGLDRGAARFVGLGLSGAIAALAGVVYLASVPAGAAPGAFDASRSLDLLALAVVGGLGSAIGAGVGAAALVAAGVLLPAPWGSVATGTGVLWVVLLAPAGVGGALAALRDVAARVVVPAQMPARPPQVTVDDDHGRIAKLPKTAIVAGADTREALRTPTLRAAIVAAVCVGALSLAALFGAVPATRDHLGFDAGPLAPWFVLGVASVCAGIVVVAWRAAPASPSAVVLTAAGSAATLVAFVVTGDDVMVAALMVVGPVVGAWLLANLARAAAHAVVARTAPAACGLVVAGALAGGIGAAHLGAVTAGNDLLDAARWAVPYAVVGVLAAWRTVAHVGDDARRARQRAAAVPERTTRRHWTPLRVESLTVDFGANRILDGVELEVASGEVLAVVGANGAGKSTLLRAIAGLNEPVAGRIDVAGEEITALRPDERAAVGVALVAGARPVFAGLTVRENLRVGAHLTHRTRSAFASALGPVLELVPVLGGRLETPAGVLSGGEQRQLAIAQTLFRRPTLLLADEIALGLDRDAKAATFALLRTLADDGMAVIVVDHDLAAAATIADRVVAIRAGAAVDVPREALATMTTDLVPARFLAEATS